LFTGLFAFGLSTLTGIPWTLLLLAYSPGGITEMTLLALSLNLDAAFVATHHIIRISMLVLFIPVLFKLMNKKDEDNEQAKKVV
jgi:hypothetical protein